MKSYTEMTDFEINQAVGLATGEATAGEPLLGIVIRNSNGRGFDPCNSWADAGPIIQSNYLSIKCDNMPDVPMPSTYWKAHNHNGDRCWSANPLRAAMIVFLMMQKAEDHHTKSS